MKKNLILFGIVVAIVTTSIFATRAPESAIALNKIAMKEANINATKHTTLSSYFYWFYTDRTWAGMYNTLENMMFDTGYDPYDYSPRTAHYYGFYQWNVVFDANGIPSPFPFNAVPDKVLYSHPLT